MSFSANVKEELSKINIFSNINIVEAELYGYLLTVDTKSKKIKFLTENEYNINRLNKLLNKLQINYEINMQGKSYKIEFNKQDIKFSEKNFPNEEEIKAIVRGAFLGNGFITEPSNKYHLEIKLETKIRTRKNNRNTTKIWYRNKKIR